MQLAGFGKLALATNGRVDSSEVGERGDVGETVKHLHQPHRLHQADACTAEGADRDIELFKAKQYLTL